MLSYIRHWTILSCLVLVGILLFVLLLLLLLFFICFHSSSTLIFSSTASSFPSFSNSSFICCWNFVAVLGSCSSSTWNFFIFLFSSCLLYAILHLYLPLTKKKWSESLFAPLHYFTSSMLLAFLLSVNTWSIWLLVFPSGDLHVCLWTSLCGKQVEDTTMFFAAAKFTNLCPLLTIITFVFEIFLNFSSYLDSFHVTHYATLIASIHLAFILQ
jgi:hypothetical protein